MTKLYFCPSCRDSFYGIEGPLSCPSCGATQSREASYDQVVAERSTSPVDVGRAIKDCLEGLTGRRHAEHNRTESALGREAFAPMASEGRSVR
jgi:hypothetical protein